MTRRVALSALWFFAAWTAASMVGFAFSLPGWIVPIIAILVALAVLRPVADVRRAAAVIGMDRILTEH